MYIIIPPPPRIRLIYLSDGHHIELLKVCSCLEWAEERGTWYLNGKWLGPAGKKRRPEGRRMLYTICMYVYSMAFYLTGWLVAAGIHHDQMVPILGASSFPPLTLSSYRNPPFSRLRYPLPISRHQFSRLFLPAWTAAIQIDEGAVQHARPTAKKDHILWIYWERMRGWSQLASSFSLFSSFLFIFFPTSLQTGCEEQQFGWLRNERRKRERRKERRKERKKERGKAVERKFEDLGNEEELLCVCLFI